MARAESLALDQLGLAGFASRTNVAKCLRVFTKQLTKLCCMNRAVQWRWGGFLPLAFRWADWKAVIVRAWGEIRNDNVEVMAGGVAFYATLSLFPAIAALVIVYGLVADPSTLELQLTWFANSLAPAARDVLAQSLSLAAQQRTSFSISALLALSIAIWSASRATNALVLSVQVAYEDTDGRGFLRQLRLNVAFTGAALIGGAVLLASLGAAPDLLTRLGVSEGALVLVRTLRWPLIWAGYFFGLCLLFRFAPRKRSRTPNHVVRPGALVATFLWTLVSFGFGLYTERIGGYHGTYGAAATFAVLMTWLYLTAYVTIVGAELNSEIARRLTGSAVTARSSEAPVRVDP